MKKSKGKPFETTGDHLQRQHPTLMEVLPWEELPVGALQNIRFRGPSDLSWTYDADPAHDRWYLVHKDEKRKMAKAYRLPQCLVDIINNEKEKAAEDMQRRIRFALGMRG